MSGWLEEFAVLETLLRIGPATPEKVAVHMSCASSLGRSYRIASVLRELHGSGMLSFDLQSRRYAVDRVVAAQVMSQRADIVQQELARMQQLRSQLADPPASDLHVKEEDVHD